MKAKRKLGVGVPRFPLVRALGFIDESGQMTERDGEVSAVAALVIQDKEEERNELAGFVGDLRERIHGERSAEKPIKARDWKDDETERIGRLIYDRNWIATSTRVRGDEEVRKELSELSELWATEAGIDLKGWAKLPGGEEYVRWFEERHNEYTEAHRMYAGCLFHLFWNVHERFLRSRKIAAVAWTFDESFHLPEIMLPVVYRISLDALRFVVKNAYGCCKGRAKCAAVGGSIVQHL